MNSLVHAHRWTTTISSILLFYQQCWVPGSWLYRESWVWRTFDTIFQSYTQWQAEGLKGTDVLEWAETTKSISLDSQYDVTTLTDLYSGKVISSPLPLRLIPYLPPWPTFGAPVILWAHASHIAASCYVWLTGCPILITFLISERKYQSKATYGRKGLFLLIAEVHHDGEGLAARELRMLVLPHLQSGSWGGKMLRLS